MFYLIAIELDDRPYIIGLQTELVKDTEFQDACAQACYMLRSNMTSVDKILASKFWYSAPMRRQDHAIEDGEGPSAFPFADRAFVHHVFGSESERLLPPEEIT